MPYSTLITRLFWMLARCIGQGCLGVSVLIGVALFNEKAFFIGVPFIVVPLLIWARRPLQPAFRFLNEHAFRPVILKIYRRLGLAWVVWWVSHWINGLGLNTYTTSIFMGLTYTELLLALSFLGLLSLTIIKIVLFVANNARSNAVILHDEKGNKYRAYKVDEDMFDPVTGVFGLQERQKNYRSDPAHPCSWHND